MCNEIDEIAIELANYILDVKTTIRATAKVFGMAKSTVHYYLKFKLKEIDYDLYNKVKCLLRQNFEEKHIRGGMATKQKYLNENLAKLYEY